MIKKFFSSWLFQLFCVLWAAFLFLDYINFSSYYIESFIHFEYTDLIIAVLVVAAIITYVLSDKKKSGVVLEIRSYRGIYHYLFLLIVMALVMFFYIVHTEITSNATSGAVFFIFKSIGFHLGLCLILLSALSIGIYVLEKLPFSFDHATSILLSIATGFAVITLGLFLLGTFGLLNPFVVFPFLLLLILPGWKKSYSLLKDLLFKKEATFKIHLLAAMAYVIIVLLVAISLVNDVRTFPIGYDGLGLYMNTSKLIYGYHGLPHGGDAYNWSLFMSLGLILYNSIPVSILLSVVPGILCLFLIYKICSYLNINRNWSLLACALFYSQPNFIWQSKSEEKVDLALLFITLCCFLLFLNGKTIVPEKNKKPFDPSTSLGDRKAQGRPAKKLFSNSPDIARWLLCGILIGFTFGIKYAAMLNIFGFLVILFYRESGKEGAIFIFFLNLALIFGLDLTRFAAFERDYMFLRFIVPLILALVALVFAFRKKSNGLLSAGKKSVVFFLAIGIMFLPWALKNISENKSFSVESILSGKYNLPPLSAEVKVNQQSQKNPFDFAQGRPFDKAQDRPFDKAQDRRRNNLKVNYSSFSIPFLQKSPEEPTASNISVKSENQFNPGNKEKQEEIRRYLGYEPGFVKFLSLPYDSAMKSNVKLASSDMGILLLIFIPLLLFVFSLRQIPWNILKMFLLILFLGISIISVRLMNNTLDIHAILDSVHTKSFTETGTFRGLFLSVYESLLQFYLALGNFIMPIYRSLSTQANGICFVIITLLSIPLYFLFKDNSNGFSATAKTLLAFVFCIMLYWIVLTSGIIWYGIVGFSLLPVVFALLATREVDVAYGSPSTMLRTNPSTMLRTNPSTMLRNQIFVQRFISVCSIAWFVLILPFQFMPVNFTFAENNKINYKEFIDPQFAKYAVGEQSEKEVLKHYLNPPQMNILNLLNRDKNSKIINVSVPLNYFIANNDTRLYKDNQMGYFRDFYSAINENKSRLAGEYRKRNIKYILINLKAFTIDQTPDKSLTKKYDEMMNALLNNPEFRLIYTNRIVERPDGDMNLSFNGRVVVAKYELMGVHVIEPGTEALFEVL